jgi:hypothetical protein
MTFESCSHKAGDATLALSALRLFHPSGPFPWLRRHRKSKTNQPLLRKGVRSMLQLTANLTRNCGLQTSLRCDCGSFSYFPRPWAGQRLTVSNEVG